MRSENPLTRIENPLTRNENSAAVHGNVVQASRIDQLIVNAPSDGEKPVPWNLPQDPGHTGFLNRDRELGDLDRAWSDSGAGPMNVLITGQPGVGKSTLALRWLHQNESAFPGGVFYAELGGSTRYPAAPSDVLSRFLWQLGVTGANMPAAELERGDMFRQLTRECKIVVLFDDAATARQVRALLPSAGTVIITSRKDLWHTESQFRVA